MTIQYTPRRHNPWDILKHVTVTSIEIQEEHYAIVRYTYKGKGYFLELEDYEDEHSKTHCGVYAGCAANGKFPIELGGLSEAWLLPRWYVLGAAELSISTLDGGSIEIKLTKPRKRK